METNQCQENKYKHKDLKKYISDHLYYYLVIIYYYG